MNIKPSPPKPETAIQAYGRVQPQARDLEQNVLGVIMLDRDRLDEVLRIIRSPDCFYVDAHQKIYKAIQSLNLKGSPVDLLTVTDALRKSKDLDLVGGPFYLTSLTMDVTSAAKVEAHARIVMEKFMSREIIKICGSLINEAYEDTNDVFEMLESAEIKLSDITDHFRSGSIKSIGSALLPTIKAMQEAAEQQSEMLGLPTGITKLDTITLGLSAPDFIIIAAGTGEGKTTMALNIAENIATQSGPVGFFSLEMKDRQLIWKILSSRIQEDIKSIRRGKFSTDKWQTLLNQIVPALMRLGIYLYDVGGLNIVELKAIARTMKKKHGIKALFIDYIQLVRGAGKKFGTREEEVNFVSKELKALAMELEIPIIGLSQLNRIEKTNAKRMYRLSDLRETGALEQDADGVIFLYRPTEHEQTEMHVFGENMTFTEMDALADIAKWRLGATGGFRLRFDGAFNKFSDYDPLPPQSEFDLKPFSPALTAAGHKVIDFTEPLSKQQEDDQQDLPF